jgi:hypothetical protein
LTLTTSSALHRQQRAGKEAQEEVKLAINRLISQITAKKQEERELDNVA